jgi:hypothetical protein
MRLKILATILLSALTGCSQAANKPSTHPPLLPDEQSKEVLRILTLTDELDKMMRANNAGQPFVDLAKRVELEYLRCQQTLPKDNAARTVFRQTIDGYSIASSIVAGNVKNPKDTPLELVAEAYIRKTMLRRILEGRATERDWQIFEAGTKAGN